MPPTTTVLPVPEIVGATDQIAEYYRAAIRSGRFTPGDTLPSNRTMAADWDVSTTTILRAMAKLRSEHWISTRPGKPPVVSTIQSKIER